MAEPFEAIVPIVGEVGAKRQIQISYENTQLLLTTT